MTGAHAARAYVRARVRLRAGRRWYDSYGTAFTLVVLLFLAVQPLHALAARLTAGAGQAGPAGPGIGLALVTLAYVGFLALARSVGPVAVSPADAVWLVLSPLNRRGVLARTAGALLAVSALAGVVLGVVALAVLGPAAGPLLGRLAVAVVVGAALGVGGMSVTVLAQPSEAASAWLHGALLAAAALAGLAAVVAAALPSVPTGPVVDAITRTPASAAAAAACGAAAGAAALAESARRTLRRFPATAVLAASARAHAMAYAIIGLDLGAVSSAAEDERWLRSRLRSRPWPRLPGLALPAWQDWRRLRRQPRRLAALAAGAALPALVSLAGGAHAVITAVTLTGALVAAGTATSGARRDAGDPAFSQLLGVDAGGVLATRAVLPGLLTAAWLTAGLAGLMAVGALPPGPWWLFGLAAAPAISAASLRFARRAPADYTMPLIDTPMGAVPTGLLVWAVTGPDLAVAGSVPMLVALLSHPASISWLVTGQAAVSLQPRSNWPALIRRVKLAQGELNRTCSTRAATLPLITCMAVAPET